MWIFFISLENKDPKKKNNQTANKNPDPGHHKPIRMTHGNHVMNPGVLNNHLAEVVYSPLN